MAQIASKFIKNNAITTAKIANDAVDKDKIAADVAGAGLTQNVDGSLEVGAGSGISVAADTVAVDSTVIRTNGANAFSADQSMGSNKLTNVSDPVSNQDAATKAYVDSLIDGRDWKQSVKVATTAPGTLATDFENGDTVDGVVLATNDRILIKDQAAGEENGIYVVNASGAPTRSSDANTALELTGAAVFVEQGTANADKQFAQTADNITLGTTPLVWVVTSANSFSGHDMVVLSGGQISVDLASDAGLESSNPGNAAGQLRVKLNGGTLDRSASGLKVASNGITGTELNTSVAGDGIAGGGGSALSVDHDGEGLQFVTNQLALELDGSSLSKSATGLKVAANGITGTELNSSVAGAGLSGGGGSALAVNVDSSTTKITSDAVEALKHREQTISLSAGDITNQYVDLAFAAFGSSASVNSVSLAAEGVMQRKVSDYTVSLTGGAGGVTRITFAGDLATGGAAELVATDTLVIEYDYL